MKKSILILVFVFISCSIYAQNKNDIAKYTSQKLQFGFIENKGQIHDQDYKANPDVKFLLCLGNGMNVQLKANSFSYDTYKTEIKEKKKDTLADKWWTDKETEKDITYYFHRVDVELVGANANPQIIVDESSADYLNFYNAVTPESGTAYVRNYKKVIYKNIYPGIDMVYEAQPGKEKPIEYTFIVHPGVDASQIKLHYVGANQTKLTENKINVDVVHGRFTESIPASWIKETNNKLNITYKNLDKDTYGFDIPSYNKTHTLIIDPNPNLDWGTYYGASHEEYGSSITCDLSGNVFITGTTFSNAGIATTGAHQTTFGGNEDAFIVKFNSSGIRQWGTYYGGSGIDDALGISCDVSGNTYISGNTTSLSGIATAGSHQFTYGGGGTYFGDAYLVKFNSDGIRQWGTYYGGNNEDYGTGISCDGGGNVLIKGETSSTNGIATTGAYQTNFVGSKDVFVVKFSSNGVCQWGTYYGGSGYDGGMGITCDTSGSIFMTGMTYSSSGIATAGAYQTTYSNGGDAFVVKFDSNGIRQWGTYYGGTNNDNGYGIACDYNGNVFVTGNTLSTSGIATTGAQQTTFGGGTYGDAFIFKFNNSGVLQWGTYYGGSNSDGGWGISCDGGGNTYITGNTTSLIGIATSGAHQTTYGGGGTLYGDAYIAKYSSDGVLQWGTYYGGSNDDYGRGIYCDWGGNIFITGRTQSTAGIATTGANQTTNGGLLDAFIAKFSVIVTGISDIHFPDHAFSIYPNPVSDVLIIEYKGNKELINFEIFNSIGQVVFKSNLLEKKIIQMAGFFNGVYLIKLGNSKAFEVRKVIKE